MLLLIVLCFTNTPEAQVLRGTVLDAGSGKGLEGATIFIPEIKAGTTTNNRGQFIVSGLTFDEGRLQITYLGFRDTILLFDLSVLSDSGIIIRMVRSVEQIRDIVITATMTRRSAHEIPVALTVIKTQEIEDYPFGNTDDILRSVSNVYVNRSWGIFSKNASVTMRGLSSSSRTLILMDGVPLNKISGGSINWHAVNPDCIERIEVVKGPNSALYGGNAMGGVINILTKRPEKPLSAFFDLSYGSFNTLGERSGLSGSYMKNNRGLFWSLNDFYRQGDGYIFVPYKDRDSTDVALFLKEADINGLVGYRFNSKHKVEISYDYYNDRRGSGIRVYEQDGGYYEQTNSLVKAAWQGRFGEKELHVNVFNQYDRYYYQNESTNAFNEYRLSITDTRKTDKGAWLSLSGNAGGYQTYTTGIELKQGAVDSWDTYLTATDAIHYDGILAFAGLFLQDEISLLKGKVRIIAGIRCDHADFSDGNLHVEDPGRMTGFAENTDEEFERHQWFAVSPKVALQYALKDNLSLHINYGKGFMPPKLDDLCKSGKI
ncbi:MAG: TonB-dependent receptor, partial [Bacteroidetes bacterium]|nr:TonB-dependent receptor [Bacteroidota bacterium]